MLVLIQGLCHLFRVRLNAGLARMPRVLARKGARGPDILNKLAIALAVVRVLN